MTEEQFKLLPTREKWLHVEKCLNYIKMLDSMLRPTASKDIAIDWPMRKDQYERWTHVKNLYALNRDEMSNTLEEDRFSFCKNVLEQVFTYELDEAIRKTIE